MTQIVLNETRPVDHEMVMKLQRYLPFPPSSLALSSLCLLHHSPPSLSLSSSPLLREVKYLRQLLKQFTEKIPSGISSNANSVGVNSSTGGGAGGVGDYSNLSSAMLLEFNSIKVPP
jgi:hypothetical protein